VKAKQTRLKRSDFSKTIEAISERILAWSNENAPSVRLSKGRLKTLTQEQIQIEFRANVESTYGTFILSGPPRDFESEDFLPYYMDKLIDLYDRELGRLVTKNDYITNYSRLVEFDFQKSGIEYVPSQKQHYCRFCDRDESEVTFLHKSHAVAQMFGNAALLTKAECDECNDYFGGSIENDLGNFSLVARLFSRIKGQRGIPKHRDDKNRWRMEVVGNIMEIKIEEAVDLFEFSDDGKTMTSEIPSKPFRPIGAIKALLKFAISIMPDSEFAQFQNVARWVRNPNQDETIDVFIPTVFVSFFEQVHPNGGALILKRKSSSLEYPFMSFVLVFGNHHYQCFLPARADEHANAIQVMPHALISDFKPKSVVARNFGETQKITMSPSKVTLRSDVPVEKKTLQH
jgi:hypothetical protein